MCESILTGFYAVKPDQIKVVQHDVLRLILKIRLDEGLKKVTWQHGIWQRPFRAIFVRQVCWFFIPGRVRNRASGYVASAIGR